MDKDVRPSKMTMNKQTKSLHFYHAYAVKDRIDTSHLPECHLSQPSLTYNDFIPGDEDYASLKSDFTVLVTRILCQHMNFLRPSFLAVLHGTFLTYTRRK